MSWLSSTPHGQSVWGSCVCWYDDEAIWISLKNQEKEGREIHWIHMHVSVHWFSRQTDRQTQWWRCWSSLKWARKWGAALKSIATTILSHMPKKMQKSLSASRHFAPLIFNPFVMESQPNDVRLRVPRLLRVKSYHYATSVFSLAWLREKKTCPQTLSLLVCLWENFRFKIKGRIHPSTTRERNYLEHIKKPSFILKPFDPLWASFSLSVWAGRIIHRRVQKRRELNHLLSLYFLYIFSQR